MPAVFVGLVVVLDEVEEGVELQRFVHQGRAPAQSGSTEFVTWDQCNKQFTDVSYDRNKLVVGSFVKIFDFAMSLIK